VVDRSLVQTSSAEMHIHRVMFGDYRFAICIGLLAKIKRARQCSADRCRAVAYTMVYEKRTAVNFFAITSVNLDRV